MNEMRGNSTVPSDLTAIVDELGGRVMHLARRFAESEADAEDIAAEVFVTLAHQLPQFRGESSLTTYVYRICLNLGGKHRERRRTQVNHQSHLAENAPWMVAPAVDPQRHAEKRELAERVDAALEKLSEEQRDAVLLHELHGLTYAECAEILGVPEGTVKSRVYHGCRELRRRLDTYVNAPNDEYPRRPAIEPTTSSTLYQNGGI
jgi:RNA polymerase sigma-70 factor (ECF subfamily)